MSIIYLCFLCDLFLRVKLKECSLLANKLIKSRMNEQFTAYELWSCIIERRTIFEYSFNWKNVIIRQDWHSIIILNYTDVFILIK